MLDHRNRVGSQGQHQLVIFELPASRRPHHPGCRVNRADIEGKPLRARVSQEALEGNPTHPTDGVGRFGRYRVVDELVLGSDERYRDAIPGQGPQRHHRFERRHPAPDNQHPHRRFSHGSRSAVRVRGHPPNPLRSRPTTQAGQRQARRRTRGRRRARRRRRRRSGDGVTSECVWGMVHLLLRAPYVGVSGSAASWHGPAAPRRRAVPPPTRTSGRTRGPSSER